MQYKIWGVIGFFLLSAVAQAQSLYQNGKHYRALAKPQSTEEGVVEVLEFFSYTCSHCNSFEPYMQAWKKKLPEGVKIRLVPAVFRQDWTPYAQAFYAAESLGVLDKVHGKIFDAIHKQKKSLDSPEQIADVVAEFGVDRKKFLDAMNSFEVDSQIRKATKMLRSYQVQGVPTLAINGKYITGGSMAGSFTEVISVANHLIALEKTAAKSKAKSEKAPPKKK